MKTSRRYLSANVSIYCVQDETVAAAVKRLRDAVEAAFPSEYDSDIDIDDVVSAGLTCDECDT